VDQKWLEARREEVNRKLIEALDERSLLQREEFVAILARFELRLIERLKILEFKMRQLESKVNDTNEPSS
jgi:BMFP domain-containing protein YqiC